MEFANYLSIRHRSKAVPYGPAPRKDGEQNHGFRSVKGNPEGAAAIPEVQADRALRELLVAANDASTGIFTVGCVSAPVSNDRGFRRTGYVEFALNDQVAVQDAARYFPAFFHFDRLWHEQGKELPVMFNWEIEGAAFLDCNTNGFTCSVFINTGYFESQPEADACWGQALALLSMLLSSIPRDPAATAIY